MYIYAYTYTYHICTCTYTHTHTTYTTYVHVRIHIHIPHMYMYIYTYAYIIYIYIFVLTSYYTFALTFASTDQKKSIRSDGTVEQIDNGPRVPMANQRHLNLLLFHRFESKEKQEGSRFYLGFPGTNLRRKRNTETKEETM